MKYKLSELTIDGKGSYGIAASAVDYDPQKPTYLRITDINDDGTINFDGLKSVDDENSSKFVLKENDIVFARTGASTGRSYFYQKEDGNFVYAGFLIKFSLDSHKVNPRYLKYYTHSKEYYDWVHSFDSGATRGNINAKTFGDMLIDLPDRRCQDEIVSILKELDDKIAVNRRICENLEAQAQALFKNWFIDFEPFKDGEFVETELGRIPKGWEVGMLKEICVTNKRSIGRKVPSVIHYLDTGSITNNIIEQIQTLHNSTDEIPSRAKRLVQEGDIIFSTVRPNQKHYGFLLSPSLDLVVSTGFCVITANWSGYRHYIYQFLTQDKTVNLLQSIAEQSVSTYPSINASDIESLQIVIPPMSEMSKFAELLNKMYQMRDCKYKENQRLSALRDALLPKLMSGEVAV
ncbi:MAG: restriction endonuclease subunit S [Bacteroidaceae bacterium]|nr:restriction endonuclease subunit S [Bacteroidaceae bacterium]